MLMDKVSLESPAVQSYLTILQGVINRMATSSSSCKTWCITLVSAVIVIIADKGKPNYVWISAIPIVLFLLLDSYYLFLEKHFRRVYEDIVRKLHFGTATLDDMFEIAPSTGVALTSVGILRAGGSIAVWPFYALLILMLVVVKAWVL